jgi:alcohol dehydrogenase class IV
MGTYRFNTTPGLVVGAGAAGRLDEALGPLLGRQILVITDPGIRKLGLCDPALDALEKAGVRVSVFDRVEADPSAR